MGKIYEYSKCYFRFDDSFVDIPLDIKNRINEDFAGEIKRGKTYSNGEIFTIDNISINNNGVICFNMKKTNFAHYIYSRKNDLGRYLCRSIAANALILTNDNFLVLGLMNRATSLPGIIKFVGGSMSREDVLNGEISPLKCVTREALEEIGIDIEGGYNVKEVKPSFFLTRDNLSFVNVLYKVSLDLSKKELKEMFQEHKKHLNTKGLDVELDSLVFIENNLISYEEFIRQNKHVLIDYLRDFFDVYYLKCDPNNIKEDILNIR